MADKHNDNIPNLANQIAEDIPDIKENLEFHLDLFQNICGSGMSKTDATGVFPNRLNRTAVADADLTRTALTDDCIVAFTSLSAQRTYSISSADIAIAGRIFHVKDESGGARTNNIVIATEGAETIDGSATVTISHDYACISLYSNGSNLFIF